MVFVSVPRSVQIKCANGRRTNLQRCEAQRKWKKREGERIGECFIRSTVDSPTVDGANPEQDENKWYIFTPKARTVLTGAFKLDSKSF